MSRPRLRTLLIGTTTLAIAAGCSDILADDPPRQLDSPGPAPTIEPCVQQPSMDPLDTGSLSSDLLLVSQEVFGCADHAVVASGDGALVAGAQLAAAVGGPLLLPDPGLDAELARLEPRTIYVVGDEEIAEPDGAEVHRLDAAAAADATGSALGTDAQVPAGADLGGSDLAEVLGAIDAGDRVVVPETPSAADRSIVGAALAELPSGDSAEGIWLVDSVTEPLAAAAFAPYAAAAGAAVVPVDGGDLFLHAELGASLRGRPFEDVRLIGPITADIDWQLATITNGFELPGGGYELFPDDLQRTFVAFYGHPDSSAMGALGQQDGPTSTIERMRPLLDDYAEFSDIVVPTFNVIATVAHNGGSTDRPEQITDWNTPRYVDYSTMHPPSRFQEWADAAAAADGYFMMDFQPGRNEFLYQVRLYEELIRLPHTGIALDPEWRLAANQEHLQAIGQVSAEEVNEVIEWLAELVRSEGLPPKVLLLHQFQLRMIVDRDEIIDRDEVAVVIQMDGEGQSSLADKDQTWQSITAGADGAHWNWGWKNFFVRDNPRPNTAAEVMDKEPTPVYVSYQ